MACCIFAMYTSPKPPDPNFIVVLLSSSKWIIRHHCRKPNGSIMNQEGAHIYTHTYTVSKLRWERPGYNYNFESACALSAKSRKSTWYNIRGVTERHPTIFLRGRMYDGRVGVCLTVTFTSQTVVTTLRLRGPWPIPGCFWTSGTLMLTAFVILYYWQQ